MAQAGYVYVMTNPSMSGIVKIGKSQLDPNIRAKSLSSAPGVPVPFFVVYQAYFKDCDKAEKYIRAKLEKFRLSNNREFFQMGLPNAIDALIETRNRLGGYKNNPNSTEEMVDRKYDQPNAVSFGTIAGPEKSQKELLAMFTDTYMPVWIKFVKSTGLSMPQFNILMQLHLRGECNISLISDYFGISVPAVSQLVEKLVKADYLEREEDPNDHRARLLALSLRGKKLIEKAHKCHDRWFEAIGNNFTDEQKEKLTKDLKILNEAALKQLLDD